MPSPSEILFTAAQWLGIAGGGGALGWWLSYRKVGIQEIESDHEVGQSIRDELRRELAEVQERLDRVESELAEERRERAREREQRVKSQLQVLLLRHQLDFVVRMFNDMRQEQGLEPITQEDLPSADLYEDSDE